MHDSSLDRTPLTRGLATKLVLATAAALKTLDAAEPAHDRSSQLAMLAAPELPVRLRRALLHDSFGAAVDACGEFWLLAAVVVLECNTLLQAQPGWRIAGERPSPALLDAACGLCRLVPTLERVESTVARLGRGEGGSQ